MRKRSNLEIYFDVLRAVSETSKPTHIGNYAALCWKDTMKCLSFLESKGFIKAVSSRNGRIEYKLTRRGLEALEALQKIVEALRLPRQIIQLLDTDC